MKELAATADEVEKAVNEWWTYLEVKRKVASEVAERGIVPRLITELDESGENRTVKFSLVEGIAPELEGFGRLVGAKRSHVYVEGVKKPLEAIISFSSDALEGYVSASELYDAYIPPFINNPEKIFPHCLKGKIPDHDFFMLHIYSANDHEKSGFFESVTVKDVVFFDDLTGNMRAYTVRGGWRRWGNSGLKVYRGKPLYIGPSTGVDMEIVYDSFARATRRLS